MAAHTQTYLPIYNPATKIIMGMFNLGANIEFVGDETTYNLGDVTVAVMEVVPPQSLIRPVNPAYMAATFTREQFRLMQHRCSSKFTEVNDNLPAYGNRSTGALANIRDNYDGPIVAGLKNSEGFGVGLANLVPLNTVAPAITGTKTVGQTLTTTNGTWTSSNGTPTYTRQWFRNVTGGAQDVPIAGATALTYVLAVADALNTIYCYVVATNTKGQKGAKSNVTTAIAAS